MSRTIDSSIPRDKFEPYESAEELFERLPQPFHVLPDSCQSLQTTVIHEIQSLIDKQNDIDGTSLSSQEEDALDDGFILLDIKIIERKLMAWYKMFPRIKPFFALKCNPDHMVAHVLGLSPACGFDCASISEIRLALSSSGGDRRRCVYANPQRARDDLEKSIQLGIGAMTFDGIEELHKIRDSYDRHLQELIDDANEKTDEFPLPPQMILRIVVPDGHSSVPLGEKFGAAPSKVETLTEEAMKLGLDVIGVSFHCGSGCHDAEAYGTAIRIAKDSIDIINGVLRQWNEMDGKDRKECTLLDIGGGYPGVDGVGGDKHRFTAIHNDLTACEPEKEGVETVLKIANIVTPLIDELFPIGETSIQVISEPGRYFVEAAFIYCARIYSAKKDEDSGLLHYYIAQGVQDLFKDVLLCDEIFTPIPLLVYEEDGTGDTSLDSERVKDKLFDSMVHGPSGESFDVVCKDCKLPLLRVGDWLIFDRMGAYTLSIAARNSSLPVRYVLGGGGETKFDEQ
jgi:ornithine decarboxylase